MVQHARVVVVGATSYYHHGTIHIRRTSYDSAAAVSCLLCWVVREIEIESSVIS